MPCRHGGIDPAEIAIYTDLKQAVYSSSGTDDAAGGGGTFALRHVFYSLSRMPRRHVIVCSFLTAVKPFK